MDRPKRVSRPRIYKQKLTSVSGRKRKSSFQLKIKQSEKSIIVRTKSQTSLEATDIRVSDNSCHKSPLLKAMFSPHNTTLFQDDPVYDSLLEENLERQMLFSPNVPLFQSLLGDNDSFFLNY